MKKINIILALTTLLIATSCRQEADYTSNPNDALNSFGAVYSDYQCTLEFENVWNAINTGYAFWDVTPDTVDWDARYREFKPKFQALDEKINNTDFSSMTAKEKAAEITADSAEYINLFKGLVTGLKDGHMVVKAEYTSSKKNIQFATGYARPSDIYNADRLHTGEKYSKSNFYNNFIYNYARNNTNVTGFTDSGLFDCSGSTAGHTFFIYTLPNKKKVLYLWNSAFVDSASVKKVYDNSTYNHEKQTAAKTWFIAYHNFIENLVNTPKSELAGVILDLRADGGGSLPVLKNYINIFAGEEKTYWETRYKEGMGRYDMSAWTPFIIGMPSKHRDLAAEDIPLVCLCDVNSVSCAEVTAGSIKQMPTAYLIGERTWGGHGPLSDTRLYNVTYGGVAGDQTFFTAGFFVYTSNYENRPAGGPVLEGIGITPNLEIKWGNTASYNKQFEAAIEYIQSKQ